MPVRGWNVDVFGYMGILFAGVDRYRRPGDIIIGRLHTTGRPLRIATEVPYDSSVRRVLAIVRSRKLARRPLHAPDFFARTIRMLREVLIADHFSDASRGRDCSGRSRLLLGLAKDQPLLFQNNGDQTHGSHYCPKHQGYATDPLDEAIDILL